MTCAHQSIKEPRTGSESTCILCSLDIMYDGTHWTWTYGIAEAKRRKYATIFAAESAALRRLR